jgi:hypothetical protein
MVVVQPAQPLRARDRKHQVPRTGVGARAWW